MKKYIKPIFFVILCLAVCLPFTACKAVHFDESDFVLEERDSHTKYRSLYYKYFTDADFGGIFASDNRHYDIYFLVEGGAQTENVKRFIELANAELEKKGWDKLETVMVKHSLQELLDAKESINDGFERGEFKFFSVGIDVKKNRLEVEYSDISESYQEKVLKCVPEDIEVVFIYAEGGLQLGIVSDRESE